MFHFRVSVPLRGLWFLSLLIPCHTLFTLKVSVPFRGLWFLSCDNSGAIEPKSEWFPSPYGDYGSYQNNVIVFDVESKAVSVPLRGLWFLSTLIVPPREGSNKNEFPSPYGDYGSYLQTVWEYQGRHRAITFPSPYGDYGSYLIYKKQQIAN